MTKEELIKLGISLGYKYQGNTQNPQSLAQGIISFDGFGDQRITVYAESDKDITLSILGEGLRKYGRLQQIAEVKKVLQITN